VLALSTHTYTRWAVIAHHACHGGYPPTRGGGDGASARFEAKRFAVGSLARRGADWLDWMLPETRRRRSGLADRDGTVWRPNEFTHS
jgi:hypothetical protein